MTSNIDMIYTKVLVVNKIYIFAQAFDLKINFFSKFLDFEIKIFENLKLSRMETNRIWKWRSLIRSETLFSWNFFLCSSNFFISNYWRAKVFFNIRLPNVDTKDSIPYILQVAKNRLFLIFFIRTEEKIATQS